MNGHLYSYLVRQDPDWNFLFRIVWITHGQEPLSLIQQKVSHFVALKKKLIFTILPLNAVHSK